MCVIIFRTIPQTAKKEKYLGEVNSLFFLLTSSVNPNRSGPSSSPLHSISGCYSVQVELVNHYNINLVSITQVLPIGILFCASVQFSTSFHCSSPLSVVLSSVSFHLRARSWSQMSKKEKQSCQRLTFFLDDCD